MQKYAIHVNNLHTSIYQLYLAWCIDCAEFSSDHFYDFLLRNKRADTVDSYKPTEKINTNRERRKWSVNIWTGISYKLVAKESLCYLNINCFWNLR